jgi:hypothetical protein
VKPAEIDALKKLRKADLAADQIVGLAEEIVYYNAMVTFVATQLGDPSEAFVRFVADRNPSVGRVTSKVVERLTPILRKAIKSAILQHFARSLDRPPEPATTELPAAHAPTETATPETAPTPREGVVTTADELECFAIISKMIKEVNPDATVAYRDSKSYLTIIQKNVRKWFVRLGVERQPCWVAFRHWKVDEAKRLCPGVEVADGGQFGDCRFIIKAISDLTKLRSVVLAAYNAELGRVAEDADQSEPSMTEPHAESRMRH